MMKKGQQKKEWRETPVIFSFIPQPEYRVKTHPSENCYMSVYTP